ncbi:MAG: hypothetical protein GMKNLPBB_02339 [Myxococcota bacterium]|nr:hypothetical protein [Myxococcota bacterium]
MPPSFVEVFTHAALRLPAGVALALTVLGGAWLIAGYWGYRVFGVLPFVILNCRVMEAAAAQVLDGPPQGVILIAAWALAAGATGFVWHYAPQFILALMLGVLFPYWMPIEQPGSAIVLFVVGAALGTFLAFTIEFLFAPFAGAVLLLIGVGRSDNLIVLAGMTAIGVALHVLLRQFTYIDHHRLKGFEDISGGKKTGGISTPPAMKYRPVRSIPLPSADPGISLDPNISKGGYGHSYQPNTVDAADGLNRDLGSDYQSAGALPGLEGLVGSDLDPNAGPQKRRSMLPPPPPSQGQRPAPETRPSTAPQIPSPEQRDNLTPIRPRGKLQPRSMDRPQSNSNLAPPPQVPNPPRPQSHGAMPAIADEDRTRAINTGAPPPLPRRKLALLTISVVNGPTAGETKEFAIKDLPVIIGRAPECEVCLPHDSVSRKHATLEYKEGKFAVVDKGSVNGIEVNGQQVPPEKGAVLRDGYEIRLGEVTLRVSVIG